MTIKKLSSAEMSAVLFEIGLALKLRKISSADVQKYISASKISKIISEIEKDNELSRWDDSHILPGDLLKHSLEVHEISQAELARRMKISPQKINDLIGNRLTMTVRWAKAIAKELDVDYRTFL